MKSSVAVALMLIAMVGVGSAATTAPTTSDACTKVIASLQSCLEFVGPTKAATPTAGCCGVVKTTVQSSAECICQFIVLVRQGTPQIKSLGIDQARIALLPSACGLKNVTTSDCNSISQTSAPGPSSNSTSGSNFAYKMHLMLPIEALLLLAFIAFLLPFSNALGFGIFI